MIIAESLKLKIRFFKKISRKFHDEKTYSVYATNNSFLLINTSFGLLSGISWSVCNSISQSVSFFGWILICMYTIWWYGQILISLWRGIEYLSQDRSLFFAHVKTGQPGTWSLAKISPSSESFLGHIGTGILRGGLIWGQTDRRWQGVSKFHVTHTHTPDHYVFLPLG